MAMELTWKKAYAASIVVHVVVLGILACFLVGSVAKHEEEQMYVVDLDTSDLTDAGSGYAGDGGGGSAGDYKNLFPEKLSAEAVEQRTNEITQASSALKSPTTAMNEIPDVSSETLTAKATTSSDNTSASTDSSASAVTGASSSEASGSAGAGDGTGSGTGAGSGTGSGSGSGEGAGSGSGTGAGQGDGNGYGEGSGAGSGSGDSGAQGTGTGPFDTDGFWAAVNANKSYPLMAQRRGITGTVNVTVTLDAGGNCIGASASGNGILAQAATKAVYAACPYPNPTGGTVTINVPVDFELQ